MATDFPVEEDLDEGDSIETLKRLVFELQQEILSAGLPDYLRIWLLDLVRSIRDAIDRYQIRGAKGIQRELSTIIGELVSNQSEREETKSSKPSIFAKFLNAIDIMTKIAAAAEKLKPAISAGRKAIPYIKSLLGVDSELPGLPAPTGTSDVVDS